MGDLGEELPGVKSPPVPETGEDSGESSNDLPSADSRNNRLEDAAGKQTFDGLLL